MADADLASPTPQTSGPSPDAIKAEAQKRGLVPSSDAVRAEALKRGLISDTSGGGSSDYDAVYRKIRGMDADVDYDTGASPIAKWWLGRSDNPKETTLALQNLYGAGNVGQDSSGRWWVKENGRKVEVFGAGQGIETGIQKLAYGALAYSPVMGGAIIGATTADTALPELPGVSAILGAGVGAVGGKALDEMSKAMQGIYAKTPRQELDTLDQAAVFNMAFESLGPISKAILAPIKNGLKSFFGITPEGERMTRELAKGGAAPPLKTATPGMVGLQWHQSFRNKVMGDPKYAENVAYIRSQLVKTLETEGFSEPEIQKMMSQFETKDAAISSTEAGEKVSARAAQAKQALEENAGFAKEQVDAAVKLSRETLDRDIQNISTRITAVNTAETGTNVAQAIRQSRQRFGAEMSRAYDAINDFVKANVKTENVVNTANVRPIVADILFSLPENAQAPILKEMRQLPAVISLKDAHALRSQLRQMAYSGNLTPGLTEHQLSEVADAVDNSITQAGKDLEATLGTNIATQLKNLDNAYRDGIRKFRDVTLNQIVNRARTGIMPDAETVAAMIARPGEMDRFNTIWKMLPDSTKAQVAAADMNRMVVKANGDSGMFLKQLESREPFLDKLYGKSGKEILSKVRELAEFDANLPSENALKHGNIAAAVDQEIRATRMLDIFVKQNPVAALANPKTADRAVKQIIWPGRESNTIAARDFLGPNSPEWKSIQTEALKDILSRAIVKSEDLSPRVIGNAMTSVLGSYTRKQLDILFPAGLEDDLRTLAKEANFLFPASEHDMSAGLAAGAVKAGLPFTAPAWIYAKLWGWLADHPVWLHNIASASKAKDRGEMITMRRIFMRAALSSSQAGPSNPS